MIKKYEELYQKYKTKEIRLKSQYNRIGLLRLFAMICAILFFISYFLEKAGVFYLIGGLLSVVLFVYLINLHKDINEKLRYAQNMKLVNEKYIKRINGEWSQFKDNGKEFLDELHPYVLDLDIFGKSSLFQMINNTNSFFGRKRLSELLKGEDKELDNIRRRQNAVSELGEKFEFVQELEGEGIDNKNIYDYPESLISYGESSEKIFKWKSTRSLFYILPILTIGSFFYAISFDMEFLKIPTLLFMIQCLLFSIGYFKTFGVLSQIDKFKNNIEAYGNIITLIEKTDFEDVYLNELKKEFSKDGSKAIKALDDISKIMDKIHMRYNVYGLLFYTILMLGDYHCAFMMDAWKEKYGRSLQGWFKTIGEFEALSSLSVLFNMESSNYVMPTVAGEGTIVKAKNMGHPLINSKERVSNSSDLTNNIFVITGSNMSGKTTFLRTIGVNLVLSYAGGPVCGEEFTCSIMDIFTSMRISDDLSSRTSTFFAELKRIKIIVENLKKKKPMIFFIDEIFRGTNSQDRIVGAKSVLRSLNNPWVVGMISTHDFELCELKAEGRINNYHFEEYYRDNEIKFDYKIKEGISTTRNAKYLMRIIGIEI